MGARDGQDALRKCAHRRKNKRKSKRKSKRKIKRNDKPKYKRKYKRKRAPIHLSPSPKPVLQNRLKLGKGNCDARRTTRPRTSIH
ncbi:MAG: hypothetical protein ACN6P8_25125 [Achromobacter piechaudii]